jgi:hypothetical protein
VTAAPRDLEVLLADRPGSLADLGQIMGEAGVSLEGGGVFTHRGRAVAHYLVDDADRGRAALEARGVGPVSIHEVVLLRLDQEIPGQLGAFARRVADAGISILVQYSDHDHRLVLVVPPERHAQCLRIASDWEAQRTSR